MNDAFDQTGISFTKKQVLVRTFIFYDPQCRIRCPSIHYSSSPTAAGVSLSCRLTHSSGRLGQPLHHSMAPTYQEQM